MPISTFGTGPDNQRIWLDEIDCEGHESNIALCEHSGWGNQDCTHSEDLALTCSHAVGNSTDNHFIRFEESKGNHFAGKYTKEAVGADKWFAIH